MCLFRRVKEGINHLKITQKITFTVFIFAFIPILILFIVVINNMKKSVINDQIAVVKTSINQNYSQLQKTIELCNMSTQVFLNSSNLLKYLDRIKSGEKISVQDMTEFYRNDIGSMESLVNSNPYLYQIRVYVDSESMQEMMPILYQKSRMEDMDWGKWGEKEINSGSWQFDYSDTIFPKHVVKAINHIMSLTTDIPSYTYGTLGTIEVAIRMDSVFPGLFDTKENSWSCFSDNEGTWYYDQSEENKWTPFSEEILHYINLESESEQYIQAKIAGEDVILAYKPITELGGQLIYLTSLKDVVDEIGHYQRMYSFVLIMIMAVLLIVIHVVVKAMFRRFYVVFQTLHQVQKGNLDVEVPYCGTDEIGELAVQVNVMLKKIKQLVEDNIKREMLVKNSEIRALQNQINAHFIYNVLESVKMMAEVEEQYDISDAVTSLGRMLRYNMKGLSKNVTVLQEIDYIKNYIALMNLRFDYEVYLSLNIPDILWEQEIPKMSLQPIVENAICHGIEDLAEDTNIYIKGIIEETYFLIEVSDQGKGMSDETLTRLQRRLAGEVETDGGSGSGIGLKNVQDRIRMNFGQEYGLFISSKIGCYTKVSVKIPRNF